MSVIEGTWGVADTAGAIRKGEISPRESVEAAIRRIESVDPRLNAVIWNRFDEALHEADTAPRDRPLSGVPVLLKDVALEGAPFHHGSKLLAGLDWRFPVTDLFTERLCKAGAVVLGYTNIPEFLSAPTTESRLSGACRNPWNPDHSAGGSSGGAGAAVAALMVPAAQSSDGGGSSRIPASANGLFTIKTCRGRTPLAPSSATWLDISNSKSFETRSVRDFALLLDVVAGVDGRETLGALPPSRPFSQEPGAPVGKLRIGYTATGGGSSAPSHPESQKALKGAIALLQSLGHEVEEAAPDTFLSEESFAIIRGYWPSKIALQAAVVEKRLGRALSADDLEPATYAMLEFARQQSTAEFVAALDHIREFTARSLTWWKTYDLLLTPTTGSPPPLLGAITGADPKSRAAATLWGRFTPYANITGQPAASLPLHWTADGLPVGVQLIADSYREDLLLRIAAQLEEAQPWAGHVPPIHG
ncbi:amidase [Sphingobium faniae]|nr:amidase [Sphingobium faniae]